MFSWDFLRFFFSGLGWTGELWLNRVVLILKNNKDFFVYWIKIFFKYLELFEKKWFFEIFGFFDHFWNFRILDFFLEFYDFFWFFRIFVEFFLDFWIFLGFLDFSGHQKFTKMGQKNIISLFLPQEQKKPRPKAEALRRS